MARGTRTPANKIRAFRAAYIELGTVSAAARKAKVAVTTGWDLAQRAERDPKFVATRKRIDARVLNVVEDLVVDSAHIVAGRIAAPDPTPQELAAIAVKNGLRSFSYQNPKPQYFRGLVDAHRSIAARSRLDAEKTGEITGAALVIVTSKEPEQAQPSGPAPDAAPG